MWFGTSVFGEAKLVPSICGWRELIEGDERDDKEVDVTGSFALS